MGHLLWDIEGTLEHQVSLYRQGLRVALGFNNLTWNSEQTSVRLEIASSHNSPGAFNNSPNHTKGEMHIYVCTWVLSWLLQNEKCWWQLYLEVLKISQFGEDLIWRYHWKKVAGVHIFFNWWLLIFAKFIISPISPNKSSPIILQYGFKETMMIGNNTNLYEMKWCCFRPPLCTLLWLNWAMQTQGTMRKLIYRNTPLNGFFPATQWSDSSALLL